MFRLTRSWVLRLLIAVSIGSAGLFAMGALSAATPNPTSVTVAGDLETELGCPGDWQPDCADAHLTYDASDDVWQGSWTIPAGSYQYKVALNDGWDENYGLNAVPNGANIPLNLTSSGAVKFYYDHKSHWITSNHNSVIATVVGSFQSVIGCPGDWDPSCLRSWLEDPDGNGTYSFETTSLPAGTYGAKVAINEGWTENYGQGGAAGGANIPFSVPANFTRVRFDYDPTTHVLTITVGDDTTPPETTIDSGPPATTLSTTADFSFSGTDDTAASSDLTFECSLDDATFDVCTSPQTLSGLSVGSHTFQVRATDAAGNVDQSPATYVWSVLTPAEGAQDLIDAVNDVSSLSFGSKTSLNATLNAALAVLSDGNSSNDVAACQDLEAFSAKVDALVAARKLTPADASALTQEATEIETALGCP